MSSVYCGQHGTAQRRRSVTALKGRVVYCEQHGDDVVSQLFRVVRRRCSVTALQGLPVCLETMQCQLFRIFSCRLPSRLPSRRRLGRRRRLCRLLGRLCRLATVGQASWLYTLWWVVNGGP